MTGSLRRRLSILLCLLGLGMLGHAAYIPLKAWLAQQLLEHAWQQQQHGRDRHASPWPWPWADLHPIARLRQSRLGVDQLVLDGASGRSLAFGPGLVSGTVRPGLPGNSVISGHRDTHFAWLAALREGDGLLLEDRQGQSWQYRVTGMAVHHESELGLLDPLAADRLLLLSCYPFEAIDPGTPYRYAVTAVREQRLH